MLDRLGRLVTERARAVLLAGLVVFVGMAAAAGSVSDHLVQGGFFVPGSDAERARSELQTRFEAGAPNVAYLVAARVGSVDSPAAAAAGARLTRELASTPGVAQAVSYWDGSRPAALRSTDGRKALILLRVPGEADDVRRVLEKISPRYDNKVYDGLLVRAGGEPEAYRQATESTDRDLKKAEAIALPLAFVALVLVFGSAVAALLPLAIGVVAIVGTAAVLRLLTEAVPVSVFSINLTTALGLGLAIDYSLFILARYREECANGLEHHAAVVQAVRRAGRTVIFSATTVAISLSAMLVFPQYVLRSFAYAGIAVTLLTALGALVLLPALIAAAGPRRLAALNPKPFLRRRLRLQEHGGSGRRWGRLAVAVMRRPVLAGTAAAAFLVLLGLPFARADFGLSDSRLLPADASANVVFRELRESFPDIATQPLTAVAPDAPAGPSRAADTHEYAARLSALPGVKRVDAATGTYVDGRRVAPATDAAHARYDRPFGTHLDVVPAVEPVSSEGERLVADVRAQPAPYEVLVAGDAAQSADAAATVRDRLPYALALIAVTTLVLLFLFTGSVVLPFKALALNCLSLSAAFGAMVYVFQEGHLRWLVGDFTVTGRLDSTVPILLLCVLFGLSMDYEVFLLSRIKEAYEGTGDNDAAVVAGMASTGGLITAAAAILIIVFAAIATSGVTTTKLLGVGTVIAIAADATVVRGVLVPAFMRLAGRGNWWAPRGLRAVHARFRLSDAA